jgi:hypothetical protein
MLLKELEKCTHGDESAQKSVQFLLGSPVQAQIFEYLSNPLNLLTRRSAPWDTSCSAKPGFLWVMTNLFHYIYFCRFFSPSLCCLKRFTNQAIVFVLKHTSHYSARLLMALKPSQKYSSLFAGGELCRAQGIIVDSYLMSHWQSGHLTTVQLVQWVRGALDCEELFDNVDDLVGRMRQQYPENAVLVRWTILVTSLIAQRRTLQDKKSAGDTDDDEPE